MKGKLFILATNVHQGGGEKLLSALLEDCPENYEVVALLDNRMSLPECFPEKLTVKTVLPTIWQRFRAERWILKNVVPNDIVLCFGNLPPLFKLPGQVIVFVQNRYLVDKVPLSKFSFKTRLRLIIERLWLTIRMVNVDQFIVQTPSMKTLLEEKVQGNTLVCVLPLMADSQGYNRTVPSSEIKKNKVFEFLYVGSGEPHKNHRQLIEAWCLLANEGLYPSLQITLDKVNFADLCVWVNHIKNQHQLMVSNLGSVPLENMKEIYANVDALIYPSKFESFGIPLIEARQSNLPVLASELDYVRDVIDPEQTFDPDSAVSIARAVKRFLGVDEPPLPLQDAKEFIQHILARQD